MRYRGDSAVLADALRELNALHSDVEVGEQQLLLARAYEQYGLPDGTLKPAEQYGAQIPPTTKQLADAILSNIAPALSGAEEDLLTIPLGIANMTTATAYTYVNDAGGAAIVLSSVLFGSLYLANEIIEKGSKMNSEATHWPMSTIRVVTDGELPAHIFGNALFGLFKENRSPLELHFDNEITLQQRARVFEYSSAMQSFFLLHELGHLALNHFDHPERSSLGYQRFPLQGRDRELEADLWACQRIPRALCPVIEGNISVYLEATVRCFAFFEFGRQQGWFSPDQTYPSFLARWAQLVGIMDPVCMGRPKSHFLNRALTAGIKSYLYDYLLATAGYRN